MGKAGRGGIGMTGLAAGGATFGFGGAALYKIQYNYIRFEGKTYGAGFGFAFSSASSTFNLALTSFLRIPIFSVFMSH